MTAYIINMESRGDRMSQIMGEFIGRPEFEPKIVRPLPAESGAQSLFLTVQDLCKQEIARLSDCFLVVEDDHVFTSAYNVDAFASAIRDADAMGADVLLGGVTLTQRSEFEVVSDSLAKLSHFNATQFMVIYKRFYETFSHVRMRNDLTQDALISCLTDRIYCTLPFMSYQRETGYSDCTNINNDRLIVPLFHNTERLMLNSRRWKTGLFLPLRK